MIKFSEGDMSNADTGQKQDLLCQMVSHMVNAKEKSSKETKSVIPVNDTHK